MSAEVMMPMLTVAGQSLPRPRTVSQCHYALTIAYQRTASIDYENRKRGARITELEIENKQLRERVEEHERRKRERSQKARVAGKKGGRGNRG